MPLRHGGNDVFGAVGCITAEEQLRQRGLKGVRREFWQAPAVKGNAQIVLNPWKRIFLAHGDQHHVAGHAHIGLARGHQAAAPLCVVLGLHHLEPHGGELAVLVLKGFGYMEVQNRNALMQGVFLFPGRGFHLVKAAAHDDFDVGAAQAPRRAAAVHGGVAAAQHDDARRDAGDVPERHRSQPVDADMDVACDVAPAWNLQIAPARRAAAHKHRVVALLQQRAQRVHAFLVAKLHAHVKDVAGFFVDHRFGQPKTRNLAADEAARLGLAVEYGDFVAQWCQIARHRQGCGPGPHADHALAVAGCNGGHACFDVAALVVGGHALQAADGYGLRLGVVAFFHPAAPTGGLARPIAGAAQNAGKHVGHPVDHVGVVVAALADQADVFGHRRVGRAGPLAINDLVEVVRMRGVGRLQGKLQSSGLQPRRRRSAKSMAARWVRVLGGIPWIGRAAYQILIAIRGCVCRFSAAVLWSGCAVGLQSSPWPWIRLGPDGVWPKDSVRRPVRNPYPLSPVARRVAPGR